MSALTKLFVVLLVIVSVGFVAGTVVFINQQQNLSAENTVLKQQVAQANESAAAARSDATSARASAESSVKALNERLNATVAELTRARTDATAKDTTIARLEGERAKTSLDVNQLTEAVKASEAAKGQLVTQLADARKLVDQYSRRIADLDGALSESVKKGDVQLRELKYYQELFAQAQAQVDLLSRQLRDLNQKPASEETAGVAGGADPINGVVRAVDTIAGIRYATISVGSADAVRKGMRFHVIDRDQGTFLGVMTVDTVQPNEATGRVEGPKLDDIRPGVEVRTQL